ncbi:MAG: cell division protein [Acidobacteria bacterium]|nr:MAG: cell division protein [Acidobacteriota bacterium]
MSTADTLREREQSNSSPATKPAVDERRVTAWIGQGVVVEGRITSAQDLRIDGKVDGTIEVGSHGLILGASAAVKANLVARSILISGAVIGNVTATDRVDLQATGSVVGDISAPRLVLVDGAIVKGKVTVGGDRATRNPRG